MKWNITQFLKPNTKSVSTVVGVVVLLVILVYAILGWWWDSELDTFDVESFRG